MKTAMAKSSQDKKHFHWSNKVSNEDQEEEEEAPSFNPCHQKEKDLNESPSPLTRKKFQTLTIARFRTVLTSLSKNRPNLLHGLGPKVVGTLFGSRRGHVHFAFQKNPTSQPAFLIELQTPISGLVKEMASGLVRIALECDKDDEKIKKVGNSRRLLEEGVWRTFCNGKKCGFATKRECGEKEWRVLKAVEPISMGAGVLPAGDEEDEGEMMYMRAKFERVVGSRDSEAFYMMNPDSNGTPELSVYLLRV
ncbi:protein MIZU-KUSSEI 1 [Lactuca sativa]|uniref:protein MIZU-KUSSEI 1 n=1 Tax=Lactuca sativa TaxID=4236 RepID=UPI000CD8C37C|nr:protein MIZU-KUSSEI 1 [Lactuca sativa]